jgi:hypothetical protein
MRTYTGDSAGLPGQLAPTVVCHFAQLKSRLMRLLGSLLRDGGEVVSDKRVDEHTAEGDARADHRLPKQGRVTTQTKFKHHFRKNFMHQRRKKIHAPTMDKVRKLGM